MQEIYYFNHRKHSCLSLNEYAQEITLDWFNIDYWHKQNAVKSIHGGRGHTHQICWQDQDFILRHYYRGGLMAKIFNDYYFYNGLQRSRVWREWHILNELYQQHLPVPQPIAGHVVKRNSCFYSADLITKKIPNSDPLSYLLTRQPIAKELWQKIAATIHLLHDHDVYHADLNAHNILIDDAENVWIIDFDRARRQVMSNTARQTNFARLQRSLQKLKKNLPEFYWDVSHSIFRMGS
jgi:3-deoxy-D-manno-octulosonic acid kinase